MPSIFKSRQNAGEKLALHVPPCDIAIAIPRGGIPIAEPICQKYQIPLLLTFPRKLGAPNNPEFAFGAISEQGDAILNQAVIEHLKISQAYIDNCIQEELLEIQNRKNQYPSPQIAISGKTVILIDDGIATGLTMLAAIKNLKSQSPKKIIVAVPTASSDSATLIQQEVELVCLYQTDHFGSVGEYYKDFHQVSNHEAIEALKAINKQF